MNFIEEKACEQNLKYGKYFDKWRRKRSILEMVISYLVVGEVTVQ